MKFEELAKELDDTYSMGLSSRVRGNRPHDELDKRVLGSIPARAGKPLAPRRQYRAAWVYPRACGGTPSRGGLTERGRGLSPRVRGNPSNCEAVSALFGSIPAWAGEPYVIAILSSNHWVYPRLGGETRLTTPMLPMPTGLSPRVRRNRTPGREGEVVSGSIPARAGKPQVG